MAVPQGIPHISWLGSRKGHSHRDGLVLIGSCVHCLCVVCDGEAWIFTQVTVLVSLFLPWMSIPSTPAPALPHSPAAPGDSLGFSLPQHTLPLFFTGAVLLGLHMLSTVQGILTALLGFKNLAVSPEIYPGALGPP